MTTRFRNQPVISRAAMIWLLASVCAATYLPASSTASELADRLQPLIDSHRGDVGVAITHLPSGESFTHRANEPMPTASLIKFPLMIAAYQAIEDGKLHLNQKITLTDADRLRDSGILTTHFSPGTTLSLHDAIHLMITLSENTATNLVVDRVGLPVTAQKMKTLGCPNTKLHSKVTLRSTSIFPERSKQFGLGSTSAAEMVKLFTSLQAGELVSESACEQMLAHLYECANTNKCSRYLPRGTKFAQKTGSVSAVRTNAGIIESPSGPIVICVLTANNEDRSWSDDNEGDLLCSKVAKIAYEHFNNTEKKDQDPSKPRPLALGASGHLVEALQRTLNARLEPSPDIGVDGDFGPQTEQTVQDFQRANNLPDTGQVDELTWNALGPLVSKEPDRPSPEIVNSALITKHPADALTGKPFVTCKAWAVANAETGELLWGSREDEPRDMASTTKIMTAYLVTSLAEKTPSILHETITFSQRADDTIGSTAGVRAGEKISVGELLYGLMLPSGNDASVAFAEHFGSRLAPGSKVEGNDKSKNSADPYDQFVAAMNHTAKQLGMTRSSFENPNGLTASNHKTSPSDLLKLAHVAMQQPLFRKIVSTVQHGCTVEGPGGYHRNLVWKNSNRLLRTEGYSGVKTGTTRAAGSCLVSHGTHDGHSLLVVVLGSSSTDARYADSKNLFRWAWQQFAAKK